MAGTTDVVIGSGEPLTAAGLQMAFASHADLRAVGPYASMGEVLAVRPGGVAVVDVELLGAQTVLGVASLAGADVTPILFGGAEVVDALPDLLRAGARGYVPRDATAGDAVAAVRAVATGALGLSPRIQRTMTARLLDLHDAGAPRLTARERSVLRLVAEGRTTAVIAARLHLSERTVKTYLARAGAKLGTRSRAATAVQADRLGLL